MHVMIASQHKSILHFLNPFKRGSHRRLKGYIMEISGTKPWAEMFNFDKLTFIKKISTLLHSLSTQHHLGHLKKQLCSHHYGQNNYSLQVVSAQWMGLQKQMDLNWFERLEVDKNQQNLHISFWLYEK